MSKKNEEMGDEAIAEDKPIDMETEIDVGNVSQFLNKASLVGKSVKALIKNVVQGKFDKPLLVLEIEGMQYKLDLNKTNTAFLCSNFGKKPKQWLNNWVTLSATSWTGDIDGQQKTGYNVQMAK